VTGDQNDLRLERRQMLRLVAAVCAAVGADLAIDDQDRPGRRVRIDADLGADAVRGEV